MSVLAKSCKELLEEYHHNNTKKESKKLKFLLGPQDHRDVYNITAPFVLQGERFLAGRVEARDSENSEVFFFRETKEGWKKEEQYLPLHLQDPFFTMVGKEIVLGGVEVFPDPEHPGWLAWRTVFYRGASLDSLKMFAKGPDRMKDIRIKELPDGRILLFTRPQGGENGPGRIGVGILDCLEELDEEHINQAVILEHLFLPSEWGGVNEAHILKDGNIGILGHIACFDDNRDRHYYSAAFIYSPKTGDYTPMKLIAERADFAPGETKRPDLVDVIFSGGLVRRGDGYAELYCGASDAEAHMAVIPDPFVVWEKEHAGEAVKIHGNCQEASLGKGA
ncbi:MAG: DUF1861 family protein [Fusicatenibacter sp.]